MSGVRLENVRFGYGVSGFRLEIDGLGFERGTASAVIGPSGSGKTTLLHVIAGILVPEAGRVEVLDRDVTALDDAARRELRIRHLGLVFQEFELLEHLDVRENILLPFLVNPALRPDRAARERAVELARRAGIERHLGRRPSRLSQGERQRVATCRALVTSPEVILADEPTGNLDPATAATILDLLAEEAARTSAALIVVTHDHGVLERFDEVVDLATAGSRAP